MTKRELIPVTAVHTEPSLCETSCDGACCRAGVTMALFPDEAKRMIEEYGAELEIRGSVNLLGYGNYELIGDCPNLTVTDQMGICAVWGDDQWRPLICKDFQPGSPGCDTLRQGEWTGGEYR